MPKPQLNLREQLKEILPGILPDDPSDAIKGTELIRLVKFSLKQDYSDATLRYHFSIMSCDPSAPIAKVEQGQGYYRRGKTFDSVNEARNLITASQGSFGELLDSGGSMDHALARTLKFHAIYRRWSEPEYRFPLIFDTGEEASIYHDRWRFPDAVAVNWNLGMSSPDGEFLFDQGLNAIKSAMGAPPFTLSSIKMKLELNYENFREDFFQCLSHSSWAHRSEFIIGTPISDENFAEDLRKLGSKYGVGISTFGLDFERLDDLPEPETIHRFGDREFEALQRDMTYQRVTLPRESPTLDWEHIADARQENENFDQLFGWLERCLQDQRPYSFERYLKLRRN